MLRDVEDTGRAGPPLRAIAIYSYSFFSPFFFFLATTTSSTTTAAAAVGLSYLTFCIQNSAGRNRRDPPNEKKIKLPKKMSERETHLNAK